MADSDVLDNSTKQENLLPKIKQTKCTDSQKIIGAFCIIPDSGDALTKSGAAALAANLICIFAKQKI